MRLPPPSGKKALSLSRSLPTRLVGPIVCAIGLSTTPVRTESAEIDSYPQSASTQAVLQGLHSRAVPVELGQRVSLSPGFQRAALDSSLFCFDGLLTTMINPGCFNMPGASGDCTSGPGHFFVQFFDNDFMTLHQVRQLKFISNDAATVFPSAGVVLIPASENRFPTAIELANLQVQDISTTSDTMAVVVDLSSSNLFFDSSFLLAVCLQFPSSGVLTGAGVGPGMAADDTDEGNSCLFDFFTTSGGTGAWFAPSATEPQLDWGFELVVDTIVPIEALSWTQMKILYREQ